MPEEHAHEPASYIVGRILTALAEDDRTNILDIQVNIAGGKVYLMGEVDSPELLSAVEMVAREIAPSDMTVINELWLRDYTQPTTSETLP